MSNETPVEKVKRKYVSRKGEFNDLSIEQMLEKVKEMSTKIAEAKKALDANSCTSTLNAYKEAVHARVRAYQRLKAIGYVRPGKSNE